MLGHLGTTEADDAAAGVEETVVAAGVLQQEVAHDDVGKALGKTADIVLKGLSGTVGSELVVHDLIVGGHLAEDITQGLEFSRDGHGIVVGDTFEVTAVADTFGGGHNLQLRGAFVDAEDSGVAIEALAGVLFHEAAAAMDLDDSEMG